MDTILRWLAVAAVVGGVYWYYAQNEHARRSKIKPATSVTRKTQTESSSGRDEKKKTKPKKEKAVHVSVHVSVAEPNEPATTNSVLPIGSGMKDNAPKHKAGGHPSQKNEGTLLVEDTTSKVHTQSNGREAHEGMDNKEFAKLLTNAKSGTILTRPDTNGQNKKSKKANNHAARIVKLQDNDSSNAQDLSTNSSTTGGDADDDLSPAGSPPLVSQANGGSILIGGDVTDMLEAPDAKPTVLRLTNTEENRRQKPVQPREFQVQETKKQRYQRKKKEMLRAQNLEADAQRRALLEKQLRVAREAEGRPPKNGTAPAPVQKNAWGANQENGHGTKGSEPLINVSTQTHDELLDTFERVSDTSVTANGSSPNSQVKPAWTENLPSEEEQMRRLRQISSDDDWTTVDNRHKKKGAKPKAVDGLTMTNDPGLNNHLAQNMALRGNPIQNTSRGADSEANGIKPDVHPDDSTWPATW